MGGRVSIQFGPEWQEFEQRLQRYPAVQEAQLRRALTASLLLVEGTARQLAPQDTRRLSGSITHDITGTYPTLVGRVGPSVQYGRNVEFGRRAGARMPPVDALLGWVRRHWAPSIRAEARIAAARFPGRERSRAWRQAGQDALRSKAFVLARAIARRGIPPHPFMRPAFERNRVAINGIFARAGVQIVAYLAGQPL